MNETRDRERRELAALLKGLHVGLILAEEHVRAAATPAYRVAVTRERDDIRRSRWKAC